MYIHEYGKEGSFHLAREIIQNCFDECLDDDSPGNWIGISYDKSTDVLRVEDNGYNVLLVPVYAGMYGRIEKQMFYAPQKEKQAKATYRRWAKKYCKNN